MPQYFEIQNPKIEKGEGGEEISGTPLGQTKPHHRPEAHQLTKDVISFHSMTGGEESGKRMPINSPANRKSKTAIHPRSVLLVTGERGKVPPPAGRE